MTVRLYYQDPYQFRFTAKLLACTPEGDAYSAELDRTCFYPEGGGQPWDLGTLGGRRVLGVRERGGRVVHLLDGPVDSPEVEGLVDEPRRRDHMEQHTGQHMLSAAFVAVLHTPTVSMHIGETDVTIDLDRPDVTQAQVEEAEELVNRVIREDRPIRCFYPTLDEMKSLELRKTPQVEENIRVVKVEGFDCSPCCGTHCPSTGRLGLVKVRRWEHYKGKTRVTFLCGGRALADYRWKNRAVNELAELLSAKDRDLAVRVRALHDEHVEQGRSLRRLRVELLRLRASELAAGATKLGDGTLLVVHELGDGAGAEELKVLAEVFVKMPHTVFLGGAAAEKASLLFARSADCAVDCGALLKGSVAPFGGKGGGSPAMAQGGVRGESLAAVLASAREKLSSA